MNSLGNEKAIRPVEKARKTVKDRRFKRRGSAIRRACLLSASILAMTLLKAFIELLSALLTLIR